MQLDQARITVMLPVEDEGRAHDFYKDTLELADQGKTEDGRALFTTRHGDIVLVEDGEHIDHEHTALSFEVSDLVDTMKDLRDRGVKFEDYNIEGLTTVDGVVTMGDMRMAWFKDTEGNILCVHERGQA